MGVKHWLFQRTCNFIFVLFGVWLLISLIGGSFSSYESLNSLITGGSKFILLAVLILAVLNSILAGWQIAGDYAHKINLPSAALTGFGVIVSLAFLVVGIGILF